MIVLDTNVLSEPMRRDPDRRVLAWIESETESMYLTAISVGELLIGVQLLPRGRRRDGLTSSVERLLDRLDGRVLAYDEVAARIFADLHVQRRVAGNPVSAPDGMIAAVCRRQGAKLATRNTRDFEGLGVDLIDPWQT